MLTIALQIDGFSATINTVGTDIFNPLDAS